MARPNDLDITTPLGSDSPRAGDDQIRRTKEALVNFYNDVTAESGIGLERQALHGTTITSSEGFTGNLTGNTVGTHDGVIGGTTPAAGTFTDLAATGDVLLGSTTATSFTGPLTGDVDGNVSGLAGMATALNTARDITLTGDATGTVSFDGTADAGIEVTVVGGDVDSAAALTTSRSITLDGDVTGTVNFDGSDNVTLTTSLQATATSGTAVASAAKWTTSRELAVTGDVAGSVTGVDGSADISVAVAFPDGSIKDIDGLAATDGNFIVGDGTNFVLESGSTARTSLGLGSAATSDSTDFATSTQGGLADSAVQPEEALDTGTGSLTVNGIVFTVTGSGATTKITAARSGVNMFSVDASGNAIFAGNVTGNGTP